jgi:hypothetical protein
LLIFSGAAFVMSLLVLAVALIAACVAAGKLVRHSSVRSEKRTRYGFGFFNAPRFVLIYGN